LTTEAERNGEVPREPAGAPPDAAEGSSEAAEAPPGDEQELQQAAQTELSLLAEAARFATPERVQAAVEALLFAADKPVDLAALRDATQFEEEKVKEALAALQQKHAPGTSGTVLLDLSGRWQLRTDPQLSAYVRRMLQVKPMRLTRAGLWNQVRYKLARAGQEFETPLVTAPAEKPASIENYLRVVGLLYLFIGLFIFARRWNAPSNSVKCSRKWPACRWMWRNLKSSFPKTANFLP